jgi:hypothetical protein
VYEVLLLREEEVNGKNYEKKLMIMEGMLCGSCYVVKDYQRSHCDEVSSTNSLFNNCWLGIHVDTRLRRNLFLHSLLDLESDASFSFQAQSNKAWKIKNVVKTPSQKSFDKLREKEIDDIDWLLHLIIHFMYHINHPFYRIQPHKPMHTRPTTSPAAPPGCPQPTDTSKSTPNLHHKSFSFETKLINHPSETFKSLHYTRYPLTYMVGG